MDIVEKWRPILDALKVTDENKRKFMAEYAEFHMKMDSFQDTVCETNSQGDIAQNLLPLSLRILSMLNLENKNYQLKEGIPTKVFSIDVSAVYGNEEQLKLIGVDWTQKVESELVNQLIESINRDLEIHDNFYVQSAANMISLKNEGTEDTPKPVMSLYSRYHIS